MSSVLFAQLGRPRAFAADRRFAALIEPLPSGEESREDALAEAFERGRTEGAAEALARAGGAEAKRDAERERIELAFRELDDTTMAECSERLRQTVLALCEAAIAPLAIDPAGLALRIERAGALLRRAQDERRVLLHPEDLALVASRLPEGLIIEPDSSVERGGIRIETADGGVEDGPTQWRRILAEAFGEC